LTFSSPAAQAPDKRLSLNILFDWANRESYALVKLMVCYETLTLMEETMEVSRRNLAVAGVFALGASNLLHNTAARAEAADEAAVNKNVEALREALLKADKARLEQRAAN
jgi:hypothetical protein